MQLLLTYVVGECVDCGRPILFGGDCVENHAGDLVCGECRDSRWEECEDCGEWVMSDDITETANGRRICESCLEDGYRRCDDCGRWFGKYELNRTGYGDDVCEGCLSDDYERCHDCEEYFRRDDMQNIGNECFCDSCSDSWDECSDCGGLINNNRDEAFRTHDGRVICNSCYNYDYGTCEDCGGVYQYEDMEFNDYDDCYYCFDCEHRHRQSPDELMSYHSFPRDMYSARFSEFDTHKNRRSESTFGVELECDGGNFDSDGFRKWLEDGSLIHFETDGSLSNRGVECITQPCTLKFHQHEMEWHDICGELLSQGFRSHERDNCGLHVHIGRDGLTPAVISKMDFFINHADRFWSAIARRSVFYNSRFDKTKKFDKHKGLCYGGDRYQAVNTTNDSTVEVRIFKGTLKPETVIGTVETLHALIRFLEFTTLAKLTGEGELDKTVLKFIDWVGEHADLYPHAMPMFQRLLERDHVETYLPNVRRWNEKIENSKNKELKKCA